MADKETAEWLRILYPKTLQWKFIKMYETIQNMFYWWK
jgi:hypothetical protein